MKRKGVDNCTGIGKKQRTAVKEVKEADSIYDQAAPYLLVTARFPIDALTAEWSIGVNRPIDQAHKRRLRQIFDEAGVLRRDTSHRLQVACSQAQVQRILDHLKAEGQSETAATAGESPEKGDSKWPSFEGWGSVIGEKAELIAGHHRVEAFKEYLRLRQSPEEERWWVCSIYDKGFSPCMYQPRQQANSKGRHASAAPAHPASCQSRRNHPSRQSRPDMDRASNPVIQQWPAVPRFEQDSRAGDAGATQAQQSSKVSSTAAGYAMEKSQLETNDHPMVSHLDRTGNFQHLHV